MCLEKREGGLFIGLKREANPTSNRCGIGNLTKSNNHLRVFRCQCFPYLGDIRHDKPIPKSRPCVFLGHMPSYKGYRSYDPSTTKIYISNHVRFLEQVFPFTKNSKPSSTKSSTPHTLPLPFSPATPSPLVPYTLPLPLKSPLPTPEPPHSPKSSPSSPH